ncbi:MAG TPA: MFS transporter, partial [Burkholderiaceae bacterium]
MSTDSVALPDSAAAPAPAAAEPAPPAAGAQRHVAFEPLKGSELVLGTIALSLATFMNVLD